jgi:hypothetical protein
MRVLATGSGVPGLALVHNVRGGRGGP